MKFDSRTTELIALGASVAANCQSCVEYHARKAAESGVDPQEVAQAIDIGGTVRKGAAAKVNQVADSVVQPDASTGPTATGPEASSSAATCCGSAFGETSHESSGSQAGPDKCAPFMSMMAAWHSRGFPIAGESEGKA